MTLTELSNRQVSPLFQAVIEATEEAIYNSLFMATTITGHTSATAQALPLDRIAELEFGNRQGTKQVVVSHNNADH